MPSFEYNSYFMLFYFEKSVSLIQKMELIVNSYLISIFLALFYFFIYIFINFIYSRNGVNFNITSLSFSYLLL